MSLTLLQPRPQFLLVIHEEPLTLVLHRAHHLQLRAPSAPAATQDHELLHTLRDADGGHAEEHQSSVFLLDVSKDDAVLAHHVRHAVDRDVHDGQVVALGAARVDRDGPHALA